MESAIDLTDVHEQEARWHRRVQFVLVVGAIVLGFGGAADFWTAPLSVRFSPLWNLVLMVTTAGAIAFVAAVWLTAGPVGLTLSESAVTLHSPRGPTTVYRRTDRTKKFVMVDLRESPQASAAYGQVGPYLASRSGILWVSPGWKAFDISPTALDRILSVARSGGRVPSETRVRFGSFDSARRIGLGVA